MTAGPCDEPAARPRDLGRDRRRGAGPGGHDARLLAAVACCLLRGSVGGVELGLRAFAGFLLEAHPDVTSVAAVTRAHIEAYKPWLAARPGQRTARVTVNTRAHRLGTLRMFFLRIEEWVWDDRPDRVPIVFG